MAASLGFGGVCEEDFTQVLHNYQSRFIIIILKQLGFVHSQFLRESTLTQAVAFLTIIT